MQLSRDQMSLVVAKKIKKIKTSKLWQNENTNVGATFFVCEFIIQLYEASKTTVFGKYVTID